MNENRNRLINKIYSAVTTAMLIALGICFIVSCACVFSEENIERLLSEGRYNGEGLREEIGGALMRLIIPSAITLALIIGAPFISHFLPIPDQKLKAVPDSERRCAIARRRAAGALYDTDTLSAITRERRLCLVFTLSGVGLFLISLVYPLIRIFSSDTFTTLGNANEEVLTVSLVLLAFLIPSVVYATVIGFIFKKSYDREAELLRRTSEGGTPLPSPSSLSVWLKRHAALIGKIAITAALALSLAFIILGVINGGMADVLDKAAKICRECIGLG